MNSTEKHKIYEQLKQELLNINLTHEQYEEVIKLIAEEFEI